MKHRLSEPVLTQVIDHACRHLDLGQVRHWSTYTTGYEDTTLALDTTQGRYVLKAFTVERAFLARRTAAVIGAAQRAGVAHPHLYATTDGATAHTCPLGIPYLVMDRVHGRDFYTLGRPPSPSELTRLIAHVARLHTVQLTLPPVRDPWAIPHLASAARQVDRFLDEEDRVLVRAALAAMAEVDTAALPRALIHGDLTQGNVLVNGAGQVVLIDYATASRHPRIQELAVAAANLTAADPLPLPERLAALAVTYTDHHRLSTDEHRALPAYGMAAAAMEYLGALRTQHLDQTHDAENAYVLHLGQVGLRQAARALTRR